MQQHSSFSSERRIIGIVGGAGSGKTEISNFLGDNDYTNRSLSTIVKTVASEIIDYPGDIERDGTQGVVNYIQSNPDRPRTTEFDDIDRRVLDAVGNLIRQHIGPHALAGYMMDHINSHPDLTRVVIDGIRNPEEAEYLKEHGAFIMGVVMPNERRWELIQERKRPGDPQTKEAFLQLLQTEADSNPAGIRIQDALETSNVIIYNEGSLADLRTAAFLALEENGIHLEGIYPTQEGKRSLEAPEGYIPMPAGARK